MKVEVYLINDAECVLARTYYGSVKEVLRRPTFLACFNGFCAELTQDNKIHLCTADWADVPGDLATPPGVWISAAVGDQSGDVSTEVMLNTGWTQARAAEKIGKMLQQQAGCPAWKLVEPGDKFSLVEDEAEVLPSSGLTLVSSGQQGKPDQVDVHPEGTVTHEEDVEQDEELGKETTKASVDVSKSRKSNVFVYNEGKWVSHERYADPDLIHEDTAFLSDFNGRVVDYHLDADALFVSGSVWPEGPFDQPGVWVNVHMYNNMDECFNTMAFTGWSVERACDDMKSVLNLPPGNKVVWDDVGDQKVCMDAIFKIIDVDSASAVSVPNEPAAATSILDDECSLGVTSDCAKRKMTVFVRVGDECVSHVRYTWPEIVLGDGMFLCDFNGRIVEYDPDRRPDALHVSGTAGPHSKVTRPGVWVYASVWRDEWLRMLVFTGWSAERACHELGEQLQLPTWKKVQWDGPWPSLCSKLRVVDVIRSSVHIY